MLPPAAYESLSPKVRSFLWLVDRVGFVASLPTRAARRLAPPSSPAPKKILLLRCDGIGDVVLSTPAIRAVRVRFPDAEIHLMVGRWSASVAEMVEGVDKLIVHAPWGYRKLRAEKTREGWAEDVRMMRRIRKEHYDLAIDLRSDLLSILPMAFWSIPERVGRATRGGKFALTRVVGPIQPGREHEVRRTLDVVAAAGADSSDERVSLKVPDETRDRAVSVLQECGLAPRSTVLFAPGAQWQWRTWPHFGRLAAMVLEQGFQVGVVGSTHDKEHYRKIVSEAPPCVDLINRFDLKTLTAAFSVVAGFVAVESGPALLASAAGAAGVVLFGPGLPRHFGPNSGRVAILQQPCPVHPCYQRGDCERPNEWCMNRIPAQDVLDQLMPRLPGRVPSSG